MPRKKRELHQYEVPVEVTLKGYALVEATSPEHAEAAAESGQWIEFNRNAAEMTDWHVDGEAELND